MAIIENEDTPENPVGIAVEVQEGDLPENMTSEENEDGSISFFVEETPQEEDIPFDARRLGQQIRLGRDLQKRLGVSWH